MRARPGFVVVALALLLGAGCGPPKLNESKSYTLGVGDVQVMDLPAISKAQKVTVEFTSSAVDVSVYLLKDVKDGDGKAEAPPDKAQIIGEKKGKEGTFAVDVPANTATRVVVRGASTKTEVALKVTNSK